MDLDKKTIQYTGIFCLVTLLLSVLTHGLKGGNIFSLIMSFLNYIIENSGNWLEFLSNLFLGLFCSGILVLLVSIISARYKFKNSVNKMLYHIKVAKIYYDQIPYINKNRFLGISQKIVDCYKDFYQNYTEIEFISFNRKYEKKIRDLFTAFTEFVAPFNSAVIKNETQDIESKDIDFYYVEAQTMTKLKFHEFIFKYVDLYTLWDKKLFASVVESDEWTKETYSDKDRKHETIKQIMGQRK